MNKTKNIVTIIKNFFFPPGCVFCNKTMEINTRMEVCDGCLKKLPFCAVDTCCQKCGKPIVSYGKKALCYFCLNTKPLYFDRIVSEFKYKDKVQTSVQRFKGAALQNYVPVYAEFLKDAYLREYRGIGIDFVCSVPSHKNKYRSQGFDNVEQIAKAFSKATKIPFCEKALLKIRKTSKQTELGYRERLKNQRNSMVARVPERVMGKNILVIDDVCTTRATIIECSRALKAAGAKRVYGLTFATTVKENN